MDFAEFFATNDDAGKRFDRIVRCVVSNENLSSLYKLMRKGFIKLNGKKAAPETRVANGDVIAVAKFLLPNCEAHSPCIAHSQTRGALENAEIASLGTRHSLDTRHSQNGAGGKSRQAAFPYPIVFRNDALLVINKPYDISVQSSKSGGTSIAQVVAAYSKNKSLSFTPAPLHRLDRRTTGLLVCSQNIEGARWFSEQLVSHDIKKTYLALVEGVLGKTEIWEDEIAAPFDETNSSEKKFHTVEVAPADAFATANESVVTNKSATAYAFATAEASQIAEASPTVNAFAKRAVTKAFPISSGTFNHLPVSLVAFEIETGRKHQIRAQSASHSHALFGDTSYGAAALPTTFGQKLFLHAWKISFPANEIGIPAELTCPPPQNFKKILSQLLIEFD